MGNGLIISTYKGQTRFYSSANGTPLLEKEFRIITLFPIGKSIKQTYQINQTTKKIKPRLSGIKLIFDSKEHNKYKLQNDDAIEIFISKNSLKTLK